LSLGGTLVLVFGRFGSLSLVEDIVNGLGATVLYAVALPPPISVPAKSSLASDFVHRVGASRMLREKPRGCTRFGVPKTSHPIGVG
jgi:hypothetical protein